MRLKRRPRIGIIGGGIFGLSCALNLADTYDVTVFEQGPDIFCGATYANHNRHHYGFHYPRSPETALQCLEASTEFEALYGDCCMWDFFNYYCVATSHSKTTPEDYLDYCNRVGIEYFEEWPEDGVLDKSKIALSLRVKEGIYDFKILKRLVKKRIEAMPMIKIKYGHRVLSGHMEQSGDKVLIVENKNEAREFRFDYLISSIYANYNLFCDWFGFEKRLFQFNLQELDVIELPIEKRLGVTIQDGPFPSFLPLGRSNQYLLAHVEASQLIRDISSKTIPLLNRVAYVESNWPEIRDVCSEYIPVLKKATYIRSIFVDRVVDAKHLKDDARLTDFVNHGFGCWSIFAAKIITCETNAKKIAAEVRGQA
jgi:hypothetical protein